MTTSDQATLTPLTGEEEALVRAFGRAILVVPKAIDADLIREQGMSLSEYSALMFLSEAPDRMLRMSELAGACDLSVSGMTRLVGRLVGAGLVHRTRCVEDGRGAYAVLTEAGLTRLGQAWPTHLSSVRRQVLDHLGGFDLAKLAHAMQNFATDAEAPRAATSR